MCLVLAARLRGYAVTSYYLYNVTALLKWETFLMLCGVIVIPVVLAFSGCVFRLCRSSSLLSIGSVLLDVSRRN